MFIQFSCVLCLQLRIISLQFCFVVRVCELFCVVVYVVCVFTRRTSCWGHTRRGGVWAVSYKYEKQERLGR